MAKDKSNQMGWRGIELLVLKAKVNAMLAAGAM